MANFMNSFSNRLRESTLASRIRQQAAQKINAAQKAVTENLNFSELSKTITFSHSNIFDDSSASHLSPIKTARGSDQHKTILNDSSSSEDESGSDHSLDTSSGTGNPGLKLGSSVQADVHLDTELYKQQEARDRLEVEGRKLKIREEEMKLRKEQAAKDEAEVVRHQEQEEDMDNTLQNLQDKLNIRTDHVNRIQTEQQTDEAATKREEDKGIVVTAGNAEETMSVEIEEVDLAQEEEDEEQEQADEGIPECLEEEKRREAIIRQLQKTLAEEQRSLDWSREKTRKEQQKLIENIPQKMVVNREAKLKEAEKKEEERKKQLEDIQHRNKEQQRKKKAESKYIKEFETKDAEARARAREKEQGQERLQHLQFVKNLQTRKASLTGGTNLVPKAANKKKIEEDAEIAKRLQEEESLDRTRYDTWNTIRKLQEEQEKRHKDLEAEEERWRLEDQIRKVEQMKKDNDEKESRLRKMFGEEAGGGIEEDDYVQSSPSTGGLVDYFQTPAFNPKRRSTLLSLAGESPNNQSDDRPTLRAAGGTFNVPKRRGRGQAGSTSETSDSRAQRREFERTVMEAGGVTLDEQERLEMEAAEDMSSSVNPSSVSFTVSRSKEEIPTFSGDIIDYRDWKTLFESYMTPFPKPEHLSTLKNKLGKQEALIAGCTGLTVSALNRAWAILDATFGSTDRVKTILLTQIEELVTVPYTNNAMFISMVRQVRDKFDRLLRVDGLSIVGVNNYILGMFLRAMPSWLFRKASKIKREDPREWNFNSVLKLAEKSVLEIEDQNWLLKGPGSLKYQGGPGRHRGRDIHTLTTEGQEDNYEKEDYSDDYESEEVSDTATHQLHGTHRGRGSDRGFSNSAGGRGISRGAGRGAGRLSASQDSQGRGRLSRSDMKNPYAKCMVCDCEDHLTVECPVTPTMDPGKLKALTEARKICVLCGRPGHRSLFCPYHTVRMASVSDSIACKSEGCSPTPHTKVFCNINKA